MAAQNKYNPQNIIDGLNVSITDTLHNGDERTSIEEIDKAKSVLDLAITKEDLAGKTQDREQRRRFAQNIFWVVVGYLGVVMVIIFFNGFMLTNVSETVIVALLGTTTANVISLLVIVAKYLFHRVE